jgi:hypothetical protein
MTLTTFVRGDDGELEPLFDPTFDEIVPHCLLCGGGEIDSDHPPGSFRITHLAGCRWGSIAAVPHVQPEPLAAAGLVHVRPMRAR